MARERRRPRQVLSQPPLEISGTPLGRSSRSLVESPLYRVVNLAANGIYLRKFTEAMPDHIDGLVDRMKQDRSSPGPSTDQIEQDVDLCRLEVETSKASVKKYFNKHIFPESEPLGSLQCSDKQQMMKDAVPNVGSVYKVSNPVPDLLYGYNRNAFPQHQAKLVSMRAQMIANSKDLIYPFFAVEYKGNGRSIWVATNQCIGDTASCVLIAERLNDLLERIESDGIEPVNSATFSIAMNGSFARLYVTWKHGDLYYMQRVESFSLQTPNDYLKFRRYVRNILDWGTTERLKAIHDAMAILQEDSRRAFAAAKARRPPSEVSSIGKRRKSPRSSGMSKRSAAKPRGIAKAKPADAPPRQLAKRTVRRKK